MSAETVRVDMLGEATPVLGPVALPGRYTWQRDIPRTAGIGRRFAAFAADAVIVFLLVWMLATGAEALGILRIPQVKLLGQPNETLALLWIVSIFELPLQLAYFTLFEARGGRTPGKILLGLRVQHVDGSKPSLSDSFLRNLLRLLWVTPLGPAFVVLDFWALQSTELDQRMGDLAVNTIVVEDRPENA